jgi:hypothetical protein
MSTDHTSFRQIRYLDFVGRRISHVILSNPRQKMQEIFNFLIQIDIVGYPWEKISTKNLAKDI